MTIRFSCGGCSQSYSVPDEAAGKRSKCKRCGAALQVPPANLDELAPLGDGSLTDLLDEAVATEKLAAAPDPLKPAPASQSKRFSAGLVMPPWLLAAIGSGALLLLLLVCGGALLLFRGPSGAGVDNANRQADAAAANRRSNDQSSQANKIRSGDQAGGAPRDADVSSRGGHVRSADELDSGGSGSNTALAARPHVPWTATVDPPRLPTADLKVKEDFELPVNSSVELVMPRGVSPYVLLVSNVYGKEGLLEIDLRTGEAAAEVAGKHELREPLAFRSDGRYVAGLDNSRHVASVVELSTGNRQKVEPAESRRIDELCWAADGRLLTVQNKLGEPILTLWDLDSGRQQNLSIPKVDRERFAQGTVAFSPGGQYVALIMGRTLCVYELASGQCAGTISLPMMGETGTCQCEGICFSPDGAQLATFVAAGSDNYVLASWDFATGKELLVRQLNTSPYERISNARNYEGAGLTWLPGASGWLLKGHVLLDGKTGAPVWTLPSTRNNPRMALGPTRFVMFTRREGSANVLAQHVVSAEDLAEAIRVVRAGGRPSDVGLPALTNVDLASARRLTPPEGEVAWAYEPDPAGLKRKPLARPLRIDGVNGLPRTAIFARQADEVLLHWTLPANPRTGSPAQSIVQSYRVGGGREGEIELPDSASLLAASPAGNHILVGCSEDRFSPSRLDVWSLAPEKHVVAWRPYMNVSDSRNDGVTLAYFVDEQHVLTCNAGHQTVLWNLADGQPVYVFDGSHPLALSPGGRYVALWINESRQLLICEALTGACRGRADVGESAHFMHTGVFRPDGSALAARGGGSLYIWDLKTGALFADISLATGTAASPLQWLDDRYFLVGRRQLIDTINRAVVWQYDHGGATPVDDSFDAQFWFVSQDPQKEMAGYYLGALPVPSPAVQAKTAELMQEDLLILGPGGRASLSVSAGVAGVDTGLIRKSLTEELTDNGVTIDNAAPVRVVFSGSQQNTGETMTYRALDGESIEVPVLKITATLTISDNKGRTWRVQQEFQTRGRSTEDGDVQQKLADRLRSQFDGFARGVTIPKHVYPQAQSDKLEGSRLTLRGELPLTN